MINRDPVSGTVSVDLMLDGAVIETKIVGTAGLGWSILGSGDITGNGMDDLLWVTADGDRVGYWNIVNGEKSGPYRDLDQRQGLQAVGVGDFRGDGSVDVLWRDALTGALSYTDVFNGKKVGYYELGELRLSWDVAGVGDLNGDGIADLLLKNNVSGEMALWVTDPAPFEIFSVGNSLSSSDTFL